MPATNKGYEVRMFDYAAIKNGKIVERIQQSDNLGQFITMFKGTLMIIGAALAATIAGLTLALILNHKK